MERPASAPLGRGYDGTHIGSDYTDDEWQFAMAMDRWKRRHGYRMPTCAEVLEVALELGYRKQEGADDESVRHSGAVQDRP